MYVSVRAVDDFKGAETSLTLLSGSASFRDEDYNLLWPPLSPPGRCLSLSHTPILLDQLLRGFAFPETPATQMCPGS